jgi:hypothetical protein
MIVEVEAVVATGMATSVETSDCANRMAAGIEAHLGKIGNALEDETNRR